MTDRLNAIRVFVVAGVRIHREALGRLLDGRGALRLVGTSGDADACASAPADTRPDVVLIDTATVEGPAAILAIRRTIVAGAKVVALGVPATVDELVAFADAGVSGYVTLDESPDELVASIEAAARGESVSSARLAVALLDRIAALASEREPATAAVLTTREQEIVALIDLGLSNKQIAHQLHIELATVKNHVHHILAKLQVTRRADAAARWRAQEAVVVAHGPSYNGAVPRR